MKKVLKYIPLQFLLFFCFGILVANNIAISTPFLFVLSVSLLIVLTVLYLILNKRFQNSHWFAVVMYALFFSFGMLNINIHQHKNYQQHFSNQLLEKNKLQIKVTEVLKPTTYHNRYVVNVERINDTLAFGKVLMNVQKDSLQKPFTIDANFITFEPLQEVYKAKNPYQFDFKSYLEHQQIFYQLSLKNEQLFKLESSSRSLQGWAQSFRSKIQNALKSYNFDESSLAIINAMLLGQRQYLSSELRQSYANAGVMHILTVSGLHVGIIMLLLNFFFKPLERLKNGVTIKLCLILVFLWCYAVVAGLSPSVIRAVTMFSAVAIALFSKRQTNVYFTLTLSAFFLLLIKPNFLFSVGFQLSYMAVFFIVLLQNVFLKLWNPSNRILRFFWSIITVSVAAQIGVFPLSVYYFHQFPLLFLLANMVIIPFLAFLIFLGLTTIILALIGVLPQFVANFYNVVLQQLNAFVSTIANQESYLLKYLTLSLASVVLIYAFMLAVIYAVKRKSFAVTALSLLFAIGFFGVQLVEKQQLQTKNELLVLHQSRETMLANSVGDTLKVLHTTDSLTTADYRIKALLEAKNYQTVDFKKLDKNVFSFGKTSLLVVDSLATYETAFKPTVVLLVQSPKLNLERLIQTLNPKLIIADASNYKSYVAHWKAVCRKQKTPFHAVSEKGAYVLQY